MVITVRSRHFVASVPILHEHAGPTIVVVVRAASIWIIAGRPWVDGRVRIPTVGTPNEGVGITVIIGVATVHPRAVLIDAIDGVVIA